MPAASPSPKGAVAAGHPATVAAAAEILEDGGNAFDAALAALCAACVAEPVLASLGGGGFLTARTAAGETTVYDFFAHTPKRKRPPSDTDFHPIVADFGTVQQEFHIGLGAMAVPGAVSGLFTAHADLGSLPMTRLVEPAVRLARDGIRVNRFQAYIFDIVKAIYLSTDACRNQYASPSVPGALVVEGDRLAVPALADVFDALARDGADLFYQGEIAARIAADCAEGGGLLGRDDLAGYRTVRRSPLDMRYRNARMETNPPPSSGGLLIAFGLEMMQGVSFGDGGFGGREHLSALVRAMAATGLARTECRLHETDAGDARGRLLDPDLLARYRTEVAGHPPSRRGTTHISVVDKAGNAAALTVSNGEGAGYVVPGTGIVMNNMLGEEDINPHGFHQWPIDARMSSMMAPTVMAMDDGRLIALGSGGSNRIRTAVLQVLINIADFGLDLEAAVSSPRLHLEAGRLGVEAGFADPSPATRAVPDAEVRHWPDLNLFFGGVHAASLDRASGRADATGDPRRGGVGKVVRAPWS